MDHSFKDLKFQKIETEAVLRGRLITACYSYPTPVDIHEYRRIDAALVRAFGSEHSRTIATPVPFQLQLRGKVGGWPYVTGANNG